MTEKCIRIAGDQIQRGEKLLDVFNDKCFTRTKPSVKLIAVLMALLVILPSMLMILPSSWSADADPDYNVSVVYHPFVSEEEKPQNSGYNYGPTDEGYNVVKREYAGIPTTEYNPQRWVLSDGDKEPIPKWYEISGYSVGNTIVFTGWKYDTSSGISSRVIEPGDVIPEDAVTDSYGVYHIYATWGKLTGYVNTNTNVQDGVEYTEDGWFGPTNYVFKTDNLYTNIIETKYAISADGIIYYNYGPAGLISYSNIKVSNCTVLGIGNVQIDASDPRGLNGDVILDNITIVNGRSVHGGGSSGLFANGHTLILGNNITTSTSSSINQYPQVFGGSNGGSITGDTKLIIHSGIYSNVIGGGYNCDITGSTHLVFRNGTVLDTMLGGDSGDGTITKETYVYVVGGCLPADSYQETEMGISLIPNKISLDESTILTGGSNNGSIGGSTNVFISGDAKLWDVQGGGRRGQSTVDTANVEVSGNAVIMHVLCGSITDGLDGNSKAHGSPTNIKLYKGSVKNVNITVKDGAAVASVYGAGYDTYYYPYYSSMFDGGDISISIEGGTVGYVYGGGYRGAVGYSENLTGGGSPDPINSINISITGGKVLEDVFGGGRGGVDKVLHSGTDGSLGDEDGIGSMAIDDSTGFAWTCADEINISITGGEVSGNVYGGGESVVGFGNEFNINKDVAKVEANSISIDISGKAVVCGTVYGGGKGIGESELNNEDAFDIVAIKPVRNEDGVNSVDQVTPIDWHAKVPDINSTETAKTKYSSYAQVGTDSHPTNISITVKDTKDVTGVYKPSIGESADSAVFGAGGMAKTFASSISLNLNGSMKGDIFGAGESAETQTGYISVAIGTEGLSTTVVEGGVYGAGKGEAAVTTIDSNLWIDIGDAEVGSSENPTGVYGAGQAADTLIDGTIRINIGYGSVSSEIHGAVYGGGENATTTDNSNENKSRLSVDINILGSSDNSSTTIDGGVFGAGKYGFLEANSISIDLGDGSGTAPRIIGNVYGGGYGETEKRVVESNRTIVLDNAIVQGSIFGGSRLGNDGFYSNVVSSISKTAEIYLISGTVTQDVYGGGYQGHSMYDVTILFGSPAYDHIGPNHAISADLKVNSIYGGGYFDPYASSGSDSGTSTDNILMMGDVRIEIGSDGYRNVDGSGLGRIAILGDVFGAGNFSGIGGDSDIQFNGYEQTSDDKDLMIRSVQLADSLSFINSKVFLAGASEGMNPGLTHLMSLSNIGDLVMGGHSELTLYAETNEIWNYFSYDDEGAASVPSDFMDGSCGNTIRLIDGVTAMFLGGDNDGHTTIETSGGTSVSSYDGVVKGYTVIDNGVGEDYYGAFAMGSSTTRDDGGFLILDEKDGNYTVASVVEEGYIKFWYIAGATSIERIMSFQSKESDGSITYTADDIELTVPKISKSSKLYYAGAYVDYKVQNSMYVVDPTATKEYGSGTVFSMMLDGVPVSTHGYSGSWIPASSEMTEIGKKSSTMDLGSKMLTSPTMSGLMGYVVIHVIEAYSYGAGNTSVQVPVHTVNLVIGVFVENSTSDIDISITLTGSDVLTGTGYIPFPSEGGFYDYWIYNDGSSLPEGVTLVGDSTYFGRSGWTSLATDGLESDRISKAHTLFGTGGVVSPVIRATYNGDGLVDNTTMQFTVGLLAEGASYDETGFVKSYNITISFSIADPVKVYLRFSQLSSTGSDYVLSSTTGGDGAPVLSWTKSGNAEAYFVMDFGADIQSQEYTAVVGDRQYNNMQDILDALIESITWTDIYGFDYSSNFAGWFSDKSMLNKFDLGSPVSQDIVLYAKFGVRITFDYGNNTPPYETYIGYNTSLHNNGIFNIGDLGNKVNEGEEDEFEVDGTMIVGYDYFTGDSRYSGHYLVNTYGWVIVDEHGNISTEAFDFSLQLMEDRTLCLVWEVETYRVNVELVFEAEKKFTEDNYSVRGGTNQTSLVTSDKVGNFTFNVKYGTDVVFDIINGAEEYFHIGRTAAVGTYSVDGQNFNLSFNGKASSTMTLGFYVPDAGNDIYQDVKNPGTINIRMVITDTFDVTVELIHVVEFTSALGDGDTLNVTANGTTKTLTGPFDDLQSKEVQLLGLPVGTTVQLGTTVADGRGYGYSMSIWVNGSLVDEIPAVSGTVIDPVVTVALYRTVEVQNVLDWDAEGKDQNGNDLGAHITDITIYKVVAPDTVDGRWGYQYDTVKVFATDFDDLGFKCLVRENDAFLISPENGYVVQDGYSPDNTETIVKEGKTYFRITGEGYVTFGPLQSIKSPLHIYFEFLTLDGGVADDSMLESIQDWSIQIFFDSKPYSITVGKTIAESDNALLVEYTTGAKGVHYTGSLDGFIIVEDVYNGETDGNGDYVLTIRMSPTEYNIHFHPVTNADDAVPEEKVVTWTVYDGSDVCYPEGFTTAVGANGHVMVRTSDGQNPLGFMHGDEDSVNGVVLSLFDNACILHINALAQPEGDVVDVDSNRVSVLVTTDTVASGSANMTAGLLGDKQLTFSFDGLMVHYDPDGTLTFSGITGVSTGTLVMFSGGWILELSIIASPEAMP